MKQIFLFSAEWCGACKGFKKDWETIVNEAKKHNIKTEHYETGTKDKDTEEHFKEGEKIVNPPYYPAIYIGESNDKMELYKGPRLVSSVLKELDIEYHTKQCGGSNTTIQTSQSGGGTKGGCSCGKDAEDMYYKMKYLKYKAKYSKAVETLLQHVD